MDQPQPDLHPTRQLFLMLLAVAVTVPGVVIELTGQPLDPIVSALTYGAGIVGAAFILSWAAEVIQLDVGSGLALALLALIAVLPEYAVDFVLAKNAGQEFAATGNAGEPGRLALANMTGANQLLIGFGWPLVILLGTWRVKRSGATTGGSRGRNLESSEPEALPGRGHRLTWRLPRSTGSPSFSRTPSPCSTPGSWSPSMSPT